MTAAGADVFFEPKSIAVVGASPRPDNLGKVILDNLLLKYRGRLYAINPKYSSVSGVASYPSLKDVPDFVDLVVIAVNASKTPEVLEDAAAKGVRGAIIFSGGFAETGTEEGIRLQNEVASIAKNHGIRVLGPNCIGVYNSSNGVDTFFLPYGRMRRPKSGPIAVISQSGALLATLMDWAAANGIGISKAINFGNKVDIDEIDSLNYLATASDVKVIVMYLEGATRGRELVNTVKTVTDKYGKPVLVLKGGRTAQGSRATLSHTASIAGSYSVFQSALSDAGALIFDSLEDMFDAAKVLSLEPLPQGPRVAIITNSGGHGVIATDTLSLRGLEVGRASDEIVSSLKGLFPYRVSLNNPFDLTGDARPDQMRVVAETVINNGAADALLMISLVQPPTMDPDATFDMILSLRNKYPQIPLVAVTIGAEPGEKLKERLEDAGVPVFQLPDRAAKALSYLWSFRDTLTEIRKSAGRVPSVSPEERSRVDEIISIAIKEGRSKLLENEALEVLRAYGIDVADYCVATTESEAVECMAKLRPPVAAKIISPDIIHKSDVGGVRLNLTSSQEVVNAFRSIVESVRKNAPSAEVRGVLLQSMVSDGYEVIVGGRRDDEFGPVVTFGAGGLLVELLSDVSISLAPIDPEKAKLLIARTRVSRLLRGYRGLPGANIDSLAEVISRVSVLLSEHQRIKEVDINPVLARLERATAIDARIIVGGD